MKRPRKTLITPTQPSKIIFALLQFKKKLSKQTKIRLRAKRKFFEGMVFLKILVINLKTPLPYPKLNRISLRPKNNWPQSLGLIILLSILEHIELTALKEKAKNFKKPMARIF